MTDTLYLLTPADRKLLRDLMREAESLLGNAANLPYFDDDIAKAPDLYCVQTPSGGIGKRSGTEIVEVECEVFSAGPELGTGSTAETLTDAGFTVEVANSNTSPVPGNVFTLAAKDRFGTWWAVPSKTSSGLNFWNQPNSFVYNADPNDGNTYFYSDPRNCVFFSSISTAGNVILEVTYADYNVTGFLTPVTQAFSGGKQVEGSFDVRYTLGSIEPGFASTKFFSTGVSAVMEITCSDGGDPSGLCRVEVNKNGGGVVVTQSTVHAEPGTGSSYLEASFQNIDGFPPGMGSPPGSIHGPIFLANVDAYNCAAGTGVTGSDFTANGFVGGIFTGLGSGSSTIDGGTWT